MIQICLAALLVCLTYSAARKSLWTFAGLTLAASWYLLIVWKL